jgi:HK97 family phage portal protein
MDMSSEIIAGVYLAGPPVTPSYRSLENPNLPLTDPGIWEEVFGSSSAASTGEIITPDKAMMLAPFWHAVSMIASDIAALPLELYRRRPDIGPKAREADENDPLYAIVATSPNEETNANEFWTRLATDALIWGNGYALIIRDGSGEPAGMVNLLPDRTTKEIVDGRVLYVTEVNIDGRHKLQPILSADVLHIRGISTRGTVGNAVFHTARNSIGLGLAQEGYASAFFRHGGRVGGILELPMGMPKQSRDAVEEGFRKSYEGVDNPFKTVILRDSAKFHEAQSNPQDAQLVEATQSQTRAIAQWFLLPPSKLGLSDSVSYNSKAEDNQSYYDQCLKFWCKRITAACNHKLLPRGDSRYFDFDITDLMRMNLSATATAMQTLVASRIWNPNECRQWFDMLPYEGGDEFVNPNTMKDGSPTETDDAAEATEEPDSETPARSAEYLRMLFEVTNRAREKSKKPAIFLEWIDGNLINLRGLYRGADSFPFDDLVSEFRVIAGKAHADEFVSRVDELCLTLEEKLCQSKNGKP